MNYFIITVEDVHKADLGRLALSCDKGYVTFFSLENQNFYHIYRGGTDQGLTPNWRRGVPLLFFKKLQFLGKDSAGKVGGEFSKEKIRKIRREDFKQIFNQLNQIQKESNAWYSIQLVADKLSLSYFGKDEMSYEIVDCCKYHSLEKLCHNFMIELQKKIRQRREPQDTIRKYQKAILKKESEFQRLTKVSSQSYHIAFTGLSYKVLSSIARIFFTRDVVSLGLPHQASTDLYQTDRVKFRPKVSSKIRRAIVITNTAGGYLDHLNQNQQWWETGPRGVKWKHISGNFTKKRMAHLIEEEKIFQSYDLVIYRGHGAIKQGFIQWVLDDGFYRVSGHHASRYIHLSCLTVNHAKDDLIRLPFKEAVLPIGFFSDRDDSVFIQNIFRLIQENRSFREACRESLWRNKEYQFFSYWFS